VVLGPDGLSQFDALRRRDAGDKAVLFAFDLLVRDGTDVRGYPLAGRKQILGKLLRHGAGHVVFCDHVVADGLRVFEQACRLGA
jgi:bifunctional non-homologous end joining protein LigD